MSPQKRIAIYARVSSDQQAQDGTIESQLAAVNKFAYRTAFAFSLVLYPHRYRLALQPVFP
jgi:DNA invertase Pin-like site-specific DNA recombinase